MALAAAVVAAALGLAALALATCDTPSTGRAREGAPTALFMRPSLAPGRARRALHHCRHADRSAAVKRDRQFVGESGTSKLAGSTLRTCLSATSRRSAREFTVTLA